MFAAFLELFALSLFEKENINAMDSKGEVMLTIMAYLAQQESLSLSQNVKLGSQYRYQQGEIQINCNWFLGYAKDENKHPDDRAGGSQNRQAHLSRIP